MKIFNIANGIIESRKTNDMEDDCVRQSSSYRFLNESANIFNFDRKDFTLIFYSNDIENPASSVKLTNAFLYCCSPLPS